jgi:ubiquinone/menaquinone biosynthesis C-methylase UbiE
MLSKAMRNQGFRVIGVDISVESLRVFKRTDQRVSLIQGAGESLPFSNRHFQTIVCLGVWRHLRHPELVLDEICRVLGKDGNLLLGYFPPKLGGLIHIPHNFWGRMLVYLYNKTVHLFGYDDFADFDLEGKTSLTIRKRFEEVRIIDSGQHWHLIQAWYPRAILNST